MLLYDFSKHLLRDAPPVTSQRFRRVSAIGSLEQAPRATTGTREPDAFSLLEGRLVFFVAAFWHLGLDLGSQLIQVDVQKLCAALAFLPSGCGFHRFG